jgi:prepilin-type N-terminal cleavage/methylation domain-containing protein
VEGSAVLKLHWEAAAADAMLVNDMVKSCQPGDKFGQGESNSMKTACDDRQSAPQGVGERRARQRGFSLIELLIGMSIMAVSLLAIATMFSTGYSDVAAGGRTTMATTAARQLLEDIRTLPFDRITDLDALNTDNAATLVAADAGLDPGRTMARNIARKWRYALAGDLTGWGGAPDAAWSILVASGTNFGARGQITVASPNATLREITVTVFIRGRSAGEEFPLRLATTISRL